MSARTLALKTLVALDEGKTLDDSMSGLQVAPQERGLLTELVYGVARHRAKLDFVLSSVSRHPLKNLPVPTLNALRLGVYQLLCLDRIPASAAVNESVKLVRKWGHPGLVKLANALLRKVAQRGVDWPWPDREREPVHYLSVCYSLPDGLAKAWLERWGLEEAERLAGAMLERAPIWLRQNRLRSDCPSLKGEAGPLPHSWKGELTGEPTGWPGFAEGCFYVQDLGSQLVGLAVDPQPGERVIDLCAAPGGKSTQLAELMNNQGQVVAVELEAKRAIRIEENKRRLGTSIVQVVVGDARVLPLEPADRVLVDAPCGGLGVLRRKPDIKWHAARPHLPEVQASLLQQAANLVKPGGILVYSTCTLMQSENEDVVRGFLQANSDFQPDDWAPLLREAWRGDLQDGMIQLLPQRHGTDGFFIARLRRGRVG